MITKGGDFVSIQVSTRIDAATKQQFDRICTAIGISPSNALSIFIKSVINNNGIPFSLAAPPVTYTKMSREAMFGCMRGQFIMADDFDAPMEDFKEYME
jgi:addiction module RelB/DinJ family antitoxin